MNAFIDLVMNWKTVNLIEVSFIFPIENLFLTFISLVYENHFNTFDFVTKDAKGLYFIQN